MSRSACSLAKNPKRARVCIDFQQSYLQHHSPNSLTRPLFYRAFGTSLPRRSIQRKNFYAFLRGKGRNFEKPLEDGTNYLSCYDKNGELIREKIARLEERRNKDAEGKPQQEEGEEGEKKAKDGKGASRPGKRNQEQLKRDTRPFPQNEYFSSLPILSTAMRDEIYKRVTTKGKTVRQVSQEMQVEMRRVAAVVRLQTIEQNWVKEGKTLATSFQSSIHSMVPTTPFASKRDDSYRPHESINSLPVHQVTRPQLFYPAPESAQFTRAHAARVFDAHLLPADKRIPHPDMVERRRDRLGTGPSGVRIGAEEAARRANESFQAEVAQISETQQREQQRKERRTQRVQGSRHMFVFERVEAEKAGANGRGKDAVGARYGMPKMDRMKGLIKIPTKVEA